MSKDITDFLKSIGAGDPLPYQDHVSDNVGKVYRAFCSSPQCSNGRDLTIKATVSSRHKITTDKEGSVYMRRPTFCPDCGHALFWRRCKVGSNRFE